jgi:ATP-dependent DNA helicase DinG
MSSIDIENILGPGGIISKHMPGYEYRPQQIQAALAIERALAEKRHCLVEAGTGVGKSMAYLLPAIQYATHSRKVVISTFTIYLQSQLTNKDIPFLKQLFPDRQLKVALVKGRGNYLCLNNFEAEMPQLQLIADKYIEQLQKWARETETGDVSELGFTFPGWSDICSDQDTCHRQNCRWYGRCFYYKMRRAAEDAEIVVANHSLFFSDLGIKMFDPNSGVLPDYQAVVFDEAHHLEDVATKAFGIEFSNYRITNLLNRIRRTKGLAVSVSRLQAIDNLNSELFEAFNRYPKQEFFFSEVFEAEDKKRIENIVSSLCTTLGELATELSFQETEERPELKDRVEGLKRICTRCREELLILFFGTDEGYFKWGERTANGKLVTCVLRYSPLTVADILADSLWRQVDTAILTSATLSNSGTFSYIRSRLGITECIELIVDSPFDYHSQCLLYIPRHLPYPSEDPEYADMVAEEMANLVEISHGRAFLLFTSYRMMNAVYERLCERLPYKMFKQGDMSNEALIQEFLSQKNSVLLGVHSFWEGVDIRGEALSLVVIDKLPFSVPDNPVTRARIEDINSKGGDWFSEYAVPQAQIRLKQGFGRLIRTKNDRGVVAILDSRLVKKHYGREFLDFLPKCRITFSLKDVEEFYRNNSPG